MSPINLSFHFRESGKPRVTEAWEEQKKKIIKNEEQQSMSKKRKTEEHLRNSTKPKSWFFKRISKIDFSKN